MRDFAKHFRWVIVVGIVALGPAIHADPPMEIEIDGEAVVISNVEPGAKVLYFSVLREALGYVPHTERRDLIVVDDDGDGTIRIELGFVPPLKYVGIAIEMASSGRFAAVTPAGSSARQVAFPAQSLRGQGNRLDELDSDGDYVEIALVRPGVGAWSAGASDGGSIDLGDANDGRVLTALADMQPIGDSPPPPDEFEKDDVLIKVSPRQAEYYAVRLNPHPSSP